MATATIIVLNAHRQPADASAGSRAARATSESAVIWASFTLGAASTEAHQSSGMRSRCHHLRAAATLAPISVAIASGEPHSEIIERKSETAMHSPIGQLVLKSKPILSHDAGCPPGQTVLMGKDQTESEFNRAFIARVRQAREARGLTQEEMAELLETTQGTYKQYEKRSLLPHRYINKFAAICSVDLSWLYTGRGRAPAPAVRPPAATEAPQRSRRSRTGAAA